MTLFTYLLLGLIPTIIVIGIVEYFARKKKWQSCKICFNALFNVL